MTYINTGDWVEHCTALVEHHDGELVLESFFPVSPARRPVLTGQSRAQRAQKPAVADEYVLAFAEIGARVA